MSEPIKSPRNEKLKLARRLADRRARLREGLFVTEGEDLLAAGRDAGVEPETLLVATGSAIEGTEVEPELLAGVSALGSGTRALAIWRLPEPDAAVSPLQVFLDGIADPGNVGAIVRSAAALCGAQVVLGPDSADPYGPKAARASMGALFAYPPRRATVGETPSPRLGLVAHGGAVLDEAITALGPRTLCLGAEREGLGADTAAACDRLASIPLRPGAESLNVAASAAIALQRLSSAALSLEAPGAATERGVDHA
jgi:RNA methyltransferase, TrmH family